MTMRKNNVVSLTLAAIIGGLAIHGAFVACSGGGGGADVANAQASSCQQWAVFPEAYSAYPRTGPSIPVANAPSAQTWLIPEGWEPFGTVSSGLVVRRCVR